MTRLTLKILGLLAGSLLLTACASTNISSPVPPKKGSICNGSLSTRPLAKSSTCYRATTVERMQKLLNQYGYDAGPEDGVFGRRTLDAYAAFLKKQNRAADAYLTSRTIRYMQSVAGDYPTLETKSADTDQTYAATGTTQQTKSATNAKEDAAALTPDNLSGRWVPTQLYNGRGRDRRKISRNLLKVVYDFEKIGEGRYRADKSWRSGIGEQTSAELVIRAKRDGFSLRLASNSATLRKGFPASSIVPKRSAHGVDIMTNVTVSTTSDSMYFIRFRDTAAAREAGIAKLDYAEFCSGPARQLANNARAERDALKGLAGTADTFASGFSSRKAIALGLFSDDGVKSVSGRPFTELSTAARSALIERLRVCAIYHQDRGTADAIAAALFGNNFTIEAVLSDVGRSFKRNVPLESVSTASNVTADLRAADIARQALSTERSGLNASKLDGDALLDAQAAMWKKYAYKLPPSELASEMTVAATALDEREARRIAAREEELDRTAPAAPEHELILSATQKYILEDCNRAALALRDKSGDALLALGTARSVKAQGNYCVIDLHALLFSFNVRRVASEQCAIGNPTECNFIINWHCSYDLNPAFGFSPDTPNADFICPVLRQSPVKMQGVFDKKAPRRWVASLIEW